MTPSVLTEFLGIEKEKFNKAVSLLPDLEKRVFESRLSSNGNEVAKTFGVTRQAIFALLNRAAVKLSILVNSDSKLLDHMPTKRIIKNKVMAVRAAVSSFLIKNKGLTGEEISSSLAIPYIQVMFCLKNLEIKGQAKKQGNPKGINSWFPTELTMDFSSPIIPLAEDELSLPSNKRLLCFLSKQLRPVTKAELMLETKLKSCTLDSTFRMNDVKKLLVKSGHLYLPISL